MKKLLLGLSAFGLYAAPILYVESKQDDNPVVVEMGQRSISSMQDLNNIFDDVASLEADNLLQWEAINGNATAIQNNALDVIGIKDEMLNVDRYEAICTPYFGSPQNVIFKYHYDSTLNIEYWKWNGNASSFYFGSLTELKSYFAQADHICEWW